MTRLRTATVPAKQIHANLGAGGVRRRLSLPKVAVGLLGYVAVQEHLACAVVVIAPCRLSQSIPVGLTC